jgi:hypothetical protein
MYLELKARTPRAPDSDAARVGEGKASLSWPYTDPAGPIQAKHDCGPGASSHSALLSSESIQGPRLRCRGYHTRGGLLAPPGRHDVPGRTPVTSLYRIAGEGGERAGGGSAGMNGGTVLQR